MATRYTLGEYRLLLEKLSYHYKDEISRLYLEDKTSAPDDKETLHYYHLVESHGVEADVTVGWLERTTHLSGTFTPAEIVSLIERQIRQQASLFQHINLTDIEHCQAALEVAYRLYQPVKGLCALRWLQSEGVLPQE